MAITNITLTDIEAGVPKMYTVKLRKSDDTTIDIKDWDSEIIFYIDEKEISFRGINSLKDTKEQEEFISFYLSSEDTENIVNIKKESIKNNENNIINTDQAIKYKVNLTTLIEKNDFLIDDNEKIDVFLFGGSVYLV